MALPDSLKQVNPAGASRLIYADATDWPAGGTDSWGDDDDQLDMTGLTTGQARESDKLAWPTCMMLCQRIPRQPQAIQPG